MLGAIGEECWDHGYYALSIDTIADDALVSRRTMYNALRAAHERSLIEMQENVIPIVSPEWQALLREESWRTGDDRPDGRRMAGQTAFTRNPREDECGGEKQSSFPAFT